MGSHISQIEADLRDVQLLIARLEGNEKTHHIELDLALSKLQKVYDFLLHEANKMTDSNHGTIQSDEIVKTVISEAPKSEQKVKKSEDIENKINPVNTKSKDELIFLDDKTEKIEPEKHILEVHKEHNIQGHEYHKTKEILAEKYNKNQQLINEKLGQGLHKKDISGQMQFKPIKNIETAIGINEKFLFVRELFNGDADTFHKTIRIVNNAANFNEAFNYIHSTFNWNLENEASQKLLELVRRRFIIDEE
jgi:hypothetical protein